MPVGLVRNGTLYFVHLDHLGTPQKVTGAAQNLVWDSALRPFGQVEQQSFTFTQHLRFPGQYDDSEDKLSYNFFRDYDPSIGRYVESDPIGLGGGINTYAYADGNPVTKIDPLGLSDTTLDPPDWRDFFGDLLGAMYGFPAKKSGRYACNAKCYGKATSCPPRDCPTTYGYAVGSSLNEAVVAAKKEAVNKAPAGCTGKHCSARCTTPRGDHVYVDAP